MTLQPSLLPAPDAALAEAHRVIHLMLVELQTFKAQSSPHKALRSRYSRKGVCETTDGCSPLCQSWIEAINEGAAWLDRHAGGGEGTCDGR